MASTTSDQAVTEPVAIFKLANRYMIYDVNVATYLRREHNIIGVLGGTLPQASQQNVFLGMPLQLMPEEARLLVQKGVAHIVDDVAAHKRNFLGQGMSAEERKAYQSALRKQGQGAAMEQVKKSEDRKKAALQKKGATENWNDIPDDMFTPRVRKPKKEDKKKEDEPVIGGGGGVVADEDDSLFDTRINPASANGARSRASSNGSTAGPEPYGVTPTISYPPMQVDRPQPSETVELPEAQDSYPLYKHLHENGYFMAPGLRFGCQYMAYPGDPLRFHSHFLCNGLGWDEEFDLQGLVGGGRLGTGVKKGFLLGGDEADTAEGKDGNVRAFCVEWAGM
ncbi:putative tRNA-splicing endonuclease subunit tsp-4 [Fulvia fulva]|nr:putative tRNA-splicing endonuclease subunit tsp-4 [Fulvia fulva]KAK4618897.1 putative tRNA-splicing endonuclease subunit tsp-4 [Fulvia fulva]